MSKIILICVIFLFLNSAQSIGEGNCHLEGVTSANWISIYTNTAVNDVERKEFKRFRARYIKSVKIEGIDYGKYFDAKLSEDYVVITPTKAFANYERDERSNSRRIEINVYLVFECENSFIRRLAFYQPINDTNTYYPEFSKSSYIYKLPMPLPADFSLTAFGDQIEACDLDISNMRLNFSISSSAQMSLTWERATNETVKCHLAILKTKGYLRLTSNRDYEIIAEDSGAPSKSSMATLHIEIDEQRTIPPNPQFENSYYAATYHCEDDKHSIVVDGSIRLRNGYPNIKFYVVGELKHTFFVKANSNEVFLHLKENFPVDILKNKEVVFITLEAVLAKAEAAGQTLLTIDIASCGKLEREPPFVTSIAFNQENYWFEAKNGHEVLIGIVTATATPPQMIQYSLMQLDGTDISNKIDCGKYTGEITLVKEVPAGFYKFIVLAEGCDSKIKTRASLMINIEEKCYKKGPITSMIVVHITENSESYISVPCQAGVDACEYEVVGQYPLTYPMLFDFRSGYLYNGVIDREMDTIEDMAVPQFMVRLRLTQICVWARSQTEITNSSHSASKISISHKEIGREWTFIPTTIVNEPGELLVAVIVDDVNDNPPIFDCDDSVIVGYPTMEVVLQIAPPYLMKVLATDLDVGINADITYTTNSSHFMVHPRTGVIYPKSSAFEKEINLKFTVRATDMHPKSCNSLSSDIEVQVKLIDQDHLAVLTIKRLTLEDLDKTLQRLTAVANMEIKYFTAAVVPDTETSVFKGSELTHSFLRAIIYAFDTEAEPVHTEELLKAIENSNILKNFTVEKWSPRNETDVENNEDTDCQKPDNIAFIITFAILASLVILVAACSITYYIKNCRSRNLEPHNDDAGLSNFNNNPTKVGMIVIPKQLSTPFKSPSTNDDNKPDCDDDDKKEVTDTTIIVNDTNYTEDEKTNI